MRLSWCKDDNRRHISMIGSMRYDRLGKWNRGLLEDQVFVDTVVTLRGLGYGREDVGWYTGVSASQVQKVEDMYGSHEPNTHRAVMRRRLLERPPIYLLRKQIPLYMHLPIVPRWEEQEIRASRRLEEEKQTINPGSSYAEIRRKAEERKRAGLQHARYYVTYNQPYTL